MARAHEWERVLDTWFPENSLLRRTAIDGERLRVAGLFRLLPRTNGRQQRPALAHRGDAWTRATLLRRAVRGMQGYRMQPLRPASGVSTLSEQRGKDATAARSLLSGVSHAETVLSPETSGLRSIHSNSKLATNEE